MKQMTAAALLPSVAAADPLRPANLTESASTPKLCAPITLRDIDEAAIRRIKQIGVDHVLSGGPKIPWDEAELLAIATKLKTGGLALGNLMIAGFPNTIYYYCVINATDSREGNRGVGEAVSARYGGGVWQWK